MKLSVQQTMIQTILFMYSIYVLYEINAYKLLVPLYVVFWFYQYYRGSQRVSQMYEYHRKRRHLEVFLQIQDE
jgi:hypothetical protein